MKKLVKPLRHGQITIPKEFRDALELNEEDLLTVELEGQRLILEPVRPGVHRKTHGERLRELYEAFAPMREAARDMTEDEVNELIDRAVEEVRRRAIRGDKPNS
jgi:AbrB family looped-hinge helix DNA binding protein